MIQEIDFDNRTGKIMDHLMLQYTADAIRAACALFSFDAGYQVSVSYVGAEEIRTLNAEYRKVDAVTDVLSFPMEDTDERGVALLGDVVLCVDRAAEQAQEFGHSLQREICYLSVHSVLHLMGYDHEEDDEKSEMRRLEKQIMAELRIFKE